MKIIIRIHIINIIMIACCILLPLVFILYSAHVLFCSTISTSASTTLLEQSLINTCLSRQVRPWSISRDCGGSTTACRDCALSLPHIRPSNHPSHDTRRSLIYFRHQRSCDFSPTAAPCKHCLSMMWLWFWALPFQSPP